MFKKKLMLVLPLLMVALLSSCGKPNCKTKEGCLKDPNCRCWCSQKCGFRDKNASDHPIYIENDPNGKFCYCKQWDLDNYENNCILKKQVPEPAGAK